MEISISVTCGIPLRVWLLIASMRHELMVVLENVLKKSRAFLLIPLRRIAELVNGFMSLSWAAFITPDLRVLL